MKKKAIIITVAVLVVLALGIGMTLFLTNGFTVGRITAKVYNVQNVYDEIWNLLKREEYGEKTVLTNSDPVASKIYELGFFDSIRIPECNTVLSNRTGTLWIHINTGEYKTDITGDTSEIVVSYEYDIRTKTLKLYGTENENYLLDHFLTTYFAWQKAGKSSTGYSTDNLGDYSVQIMYLDN